MASNSRAVSIIINDLEQRLENLHTTRVHDDQTLNNLEYLVNECSNHLNNLISSSDSTLIANLLSSLLQIILSLTRICSEKSDFIISGPFLSHEKLTSLITMVKLLYNQIREFLKLPKLVTILAKSPYQKHFCEQLHVVSNSIDTSDSVTILICHKLLVKVLTGGDDPQQSQQPISYTKFDNIDDDFVLAVYGSILKQMSAICFKSSSDNTKETLYIKVSGVYFQVISRLLQCTNLLSQIESYHEFIQIIIQLHSCLELTCQDTRFQVDFFNHTIHLQETLEHFLVYSLSNSSKLFFDELLLELQINKNKYASLIILFRIIEIFDIYLTKKQQSNNISIYLIDLFIFHLFYLIDQCRIQFVLPALLPISYGKIQVEYINLYDITYSLLMKLFQHEPMQTVLSSMNKLLDENSLIILTISNQLASELIIQSWYLYNQSLEFQYLFSLFLAELLRYDLHSSLINHFLTISNIRSIKFRIYDVLISSNTFHRIYDLFFLLTDNNNNNNYFKEPFINSTNFSFIFPTNLQQLYSFIRLFNTELNSNQIQHTIDTCIYSIQQFLSLPIVTESISKNFLLILRLLTYLIINNMNENFKCLLGQLTQIFLLIDEQTSNDIRLEFLHVFAIHSNHLDDNDLGRLLDFILTNSIELNSNSIAFHIGCLDVVDSLKQRSSRSVNITDLIIQIIVRYGNEHQCSHILKAHLMRVFMSYVKNGNDDSLPIRIKSQCILLRASIDEFEKNKKSLEIKNNRFPDENKLKILDSIRPTMLTTTIKKDLMINERDAQLKFYQTIVNELEFHQCSISTQNSNEMQQD